MLKFKLGQYVKVSADDCWFTGGCDVGRIHRIPVDNERRYYVKGNQNSNGHACAYFIEAKYLTLI